MNPPILPQTSSTRSQSAARTRAAIWPLLLVIVLTATACLSTTAPTAVPPAPTPAAMPTAAAPTVPPAPTGQPTPAATSAVTLPAAPQLSADQVIKAVRAAWAAADKLPARQVKQTVAKGSVTLSSAEAQFVAPGSYHLVMKLMGQVVGEQYFYGGTLYVMSNAGGSPNPGKWGKLPTGSAQAFQTVLGGMADAVVSQITFADGKVEGVQVVNGVAAIGYSYTTQLQGFPDKTAYKVWVEAVMGVPVRQEKTSARGETTVQDITYDPAVKVVVPPDVLAAPLVKE